MCICVIMSDYSLNGGLIQHARYRDAIEPLHGSDSRLHGLLRPDVRRSDVVGEQVAIVLQPRLQEAKGPRESGRERERQRGEGKKREKRLSVRHQTAHIHTHALSFHLPLGRSTQLGPAQRAGPVLWHCTHEEAPCN